MSQGTMAWWRLGSVFLVVVAAAAAFATAASEIWQSVDTDNWESVPEIQDEAVSGKWVDLYDSKDRRQASDDYDEDVYSDAIAQVGEEENALTPRGKKQKCPFTPSPEDVSTTPQTVTAVPPRPAIPTRPTVLPPRPAMMPTRPRPRPSASFPFVTLLPTLSPTPPVSSTGAQNCAVYLGQRVACGSVTISRTACLEAGCCFESTCFYPLNECSKDGHFVFAINRDALKRDSVDPTGLVIPSDRACRPVIVDRMYAIFKFSIYECGTHHYQVGGANVYLTEVATPITAMSLKYGVITRSKFVRFLFECRYDVGGPVGHTSLFTIGYMVKTPFSSFPSQIISDGLFAIQLRIAREPTFTSWADDHRHRPLGDHLPLRELVNGEPVYLEVRLRSPQPKAVLLVNYCIAYTRYATNALVLIYEGCENPLDDTVAILRVTEANRYKRRFKVDAFQFMDLRTNKFIDDDIYFMCSTELCMPIERHCEERCFDGRQRPLP